MDGKDLRKRMKREREMWIDVAPGKRLKFLRPDLDDALDLARMRPSTFADYLLGWEGMVESDFIANGGSDPVEFDKDLGRDLLRDHMHFSQTVNEAIVNAVVAHKKRTEDVVKNSETSST